MVIEKKQNTESKTEEDFVSKTQLKNEAKASQDFAKQLVALAAAKVKLLPLSDTTLHAIADYHKQSGNIAKKRHLAFIGKCLRNDNAEEARQVIIENKFSQLRESQNQATSSAENEVTGDVKTNNQNTELVQLLLNKGDQQIQKLIEDNPTLNRQTLRQLVRNIGKANTEVKISQATQKLVDFLEKNQVS